MNKEKLHNFISNIDNRLKVAEDKPEPPKIKANISNLVLLPFGIFLHNWRSFLVLSCIFAPLISILAFATHNSVICGMVPDTAPFGCIAPNNALYSTFLMLRLLIVVVFLRAWCRISVKNEIIDIRELLVITIQDWKLFAMIMLFIFINILPLISIMMLANRVPNPDWRIESLYFAFAACGFVIPFLAIRFYSYPAFIAEGKPLPSFLSVMKNSADNGLKLLLSFVLIVLFCALSIFYYGSLTARLLEYHKVVFGIVCEIGYDILFLALMAIVFNYSAIQKMELFHETEPQPATEEE